jgi:dienelactone hydrolase
VTRRWPVALAATLFAFAALAQNALPQRVEFDRPDGQHLAGYLYMPAGKTSRVPAVVMMHGRAGPYSTAAHGVFDATTLSKRHAFWGALWASEGYAALLVDSFGPRGFPAGFPVHSYDDRPDAVNEVTVRPFDAYAALAWLRTRPDIDGAHIGLQGWSNGGSATLAAMADTTLTEAKLTPKDGFRGALALYPACGLHGQFKTHYLPYAKVLVFGGTDDEEVSAGRCARLVDMSRNEGGDISIVVYPDATHDFDDPGAKRQGIAANRDAAADAIARARAFMKRALAAGQ